MAEQAPDTRHLSDQENIRHRYAQIRQDSHTLCEPLATEDFVIQTMPDVSPVKWHLAHTSWFFETFILKPYQKDFQPFHPQYEFLFNSYYEQVGEFYPRPQRGLLSRPTVDEVMSYRRYVDEAMLDLLAETQHVQRDEIHRRCHIGIYHEQQHQELMLTDIKHIFAHNPLKPVYRDLPIPESEQVVALDWHEQPGGLYEIGANGNDGFVYDNETPRHKTYLEAFRIATRLVSNAEYLEFIDAGGYRQPQHWLSDGWKTVQSNNWQAPLYWEKHADGWYEMTLGGLRPLDMHAPVSHVSQFEAAAYASWRNRRLPTEAEWEVVAATLPVEGNLRDTGLLQPCATSRSGLSQFYGDVWEWTQSSYCGYPGYKADRGALGEYNGKFMSSQMVLRGGSCVTPHNHIRATYRNFFYPGDRWQFSGIRLAEDM